MVKVIMLLARRADRSWEEFWRYLQEEHLPLVRQMPGRQRLVVSYVLSAPDGAELACDAVAEDWYDSPQTMQAAVASRQGQAVSADTLNFADPARPTALVVKEATIVPAEHRRVQR